MRTSPSLLAQIGRLATPAEASQVVHGKAQDFFREARAAARMASVASVQALLVSGCIIHSPCKLQCQGACQALLLQVCRVLPWVVSNYKLDELSSVPELRRNIALLFRKHSHVTAPGVSRWACCCNCFAATGSDAVQACT